MSVLVQVLKHYVREQFNTENSHCGIAKTRCPSLLTIDIEINFFVESNYDFADLFEILLAHIRDISRKTTYCIEKRSLNCTCTLYNTQYVNLLRY